MAQFAGIQLGLLGDEVLDEPNPHRWQLNGYAGVRGRERIDLGTDGGTVSVSCTVSGPDLPSLLSAEQALYGYQITGEAQPFVGNMGEYYPALILTRLKRTSRIMPGLGGGYIRRFLLTFEYDT